MPSETCRRVSSVIVTSIERNFQSHGELVGRHPWRYIGLMCLIFTSAMLGLIRFRQEKYPLRLWIPQNSMFVRDTNWLMSEFGEGLRMQFVLVTSEDVLQPQILNQLLDIHSQLDNIPGELSMWNDVCFKVPKIEFNIKQEGNFFESHPEENQNSFMNFDSLADNVKPPEMLNSQARDIQQMMTDESLDPSVFLGDLYCSIVRNMKKDCLQHNILDLWKYNPAVVKNLTKLDIITKINSTVISPTLGHPIDYTKLLGNITVDESGAIVAAGALLSLWMVHVNFSTVDMDQVGNQGGTADWANGPGLEWESKFLDVMENASKSAHGMQVFYEAGRSFGDISASGMFQDMDKLVVGVILMLIYIQIQQTYKSCVQSRIFPCSIGLLCIGMAFVAACGVCSLLGIPYGPVHTSLPFLLLGIGVDDMFVILSCWENLSKEERMSSISKRTGFTMRHAGLSITITSATDFVAFLVGSSTVLPSLQSFCLYAAVGVLLTYFLQASIFVAALALDQQRLEAGRNFLIPCVLHTPQNLTYEKTRSSCDKGLMAIFSRIIRSKFGKVFVLLLTVSFVSFGVWGTLKLKQEFDPEWFLDENSYLFKFRQIRSEYYPDLGNSAGIYMGRLQYNKELTKIGELVHQLNNRTDIVKNLDDWFYGFSRYVLVHFKTDLQHENLPDYDFRLYISQYLFSPAGSRFQKNFKFSEPLQCGKPAPDITVASFDFVFRPFKDSKERIAAMNLVKMFVKNANFTTGDKFATVWAKVFANWVTDEVIADELYRNLFLAVLCVGSTAALFLAHFAMSGWVLLCVLLTLVDVGGFMYFWGLTIDLVSCIALVLAVGLCVDFAAHIGYAFMSCHGSLEDRSLSSVVYIGSAVLHGGVTTLLALSVLVLSNSYIFKAFFKIFLLVIAFGLFHGLVFLPVVLSLIGPAPYGNTTIPEENNQLQDIEEESGKMKQTESSDHDQDEALNTDVT